MYRFYNHLEIATMSFNNNFSNSSNNTLQGNNNPIDLCVLPDGKIAANNSIASSIGARQTSNDTLGQRKEKGILTQMDEDEDMESFSEFLKVAATSDDPQDKKGKAMTTPVRLFSLHGNIYALDKEGRPSLAGFTTASAKPIVITPKPGKASLSAQTITAQTTNFPHLKPSNATSPTKEDLLTKDINPNLSDEFTESLQSSPHLSPSRVTTKNQPFSESKNSNLNRKTTNLDPELEPLLPLIMSQHEAFTPHFIELGKISLSLSKDITKKKENFSLLKDNKKIPRSLRVKVELTASPAYSTDTDFIRLKDTMKDIVSDFIRKGTDCMIEWASKNIQLLLRDRCHSIFSKALQILDVIISYHSAFMGQPSWTTAKAYSLTFYLFKLYFSGPFFTHQELLNFFDLSKDQIILIVSKILTKDSSDEEALGAYNDMSLDNIDDSSEQEYEFLTETLKLFDEIMKTTTIALWSHNLRLTKQTNAVNILKAKLTALETLNATQATALAIARATEDLNEKSSQEEYRELRLTNLEKKVKSYEQKTNEIANKINNKQSKNKLLKNFKGSLPTESLSTPSPKTLSHKKSQQMVDLTNGDDEALQVTPAISLLSPPVPQNKNTYQRKHQKSSQTPALKKSSVHWKAAEVKQYNPEYPVTTSTTLPLTTTRPITNANLGIQTPLVYYTPASLASPFLTPFQNPTTLLQQQPNNNTHQDQLVPLPVQDGKINTIQQSQFVHPQMQQNNQNHLFPVQLQEIHPSLLHHGQMTNLSIPLNQRQNNGSSLSKISRPSNKRPNNHRNQTNQSKKLRGE